MTSSSPKLRPGDVLLFQGADFLAGLAQLTERRTCYHSAIYLGSAPAAGDGPDFDHVLVHNVSTLWWRDLAAEGDPADGTLHPLTSDAIVSDGPDRRAFFEGLAQRLVASHLANPWDESTEELLTRARQLVSVGGVGAVSVDGYLDRCRRERLYGGDEAGRRGSPRPVPRRAPPPAPHRPRPGPDRARGLREHGGPRRRGNGP